MPCNTAIFYDIENLLKGYSFSQQRIKNLSLRKIVEAIKRTGLVEQIVVQKAYADWRYPRLCTMHGAIKALGIDPVQVFESSRDRKKNAADIQLAIDAIDLVHVCPTIDIFVIVSGDGGFASLANKLHEYGKRVIGCAYQNTTNKRFQAVCDAFVRIVDPQEKESQKLGRVALSVIGKYVVRDPRNIRLAQNIATSQSMAHDIALEKTKEILNWYASDAICRSELTEQGIQLPVVREAVKYAIPGFQITRFGYINFAEFLQNACEGTALCVGRLLNSPAALYLKDLIWPEIEILPDVHRQDLETVMGYRLLLATERPIFRLPAAAELQAIVAWLGMHPPENAEFGSIIESAVMGLNGGVTAEDVRFGIFSLISAKVIQRERKSGPIGEKKLTLHADIRTPAAILATLRGAVRNKLVPLLGNVRDDVLGQLLGEIPETTG